MRVWGIVIGLSGALLFGAMLGRLDQQITVQKGLYRVYNDGCDTPWVIRGLTGAEKKAHFFVYELGCKMVLITDSHGTVVDTVSKNDGRDIANVD
jgi:hypothetical protein